MAHPEKEAPDRHGLNRLIWLGMVLQFAFMPNEWIVLLGLISAARQVYGSFEAESYYYGLLTILR